MAMNREQLKEYHAHLRMRGQEQGERIVDQIPAWFYAQVAAAVAVSVLEYAANNAKSTRPMTYDDLQAMIEGFLEGAGMEQAADPMGGWTIQRKAV